MPAVLTWRRQGDFNVSDISTNSFRYATLADAPCDRGFLSRDSIATLQDELVFQRAAQCHIWALPALRSRRAKVGIGYEPCPNRGFSVILRIYGPTKRFFDRSWRPND